MPRRQRAVRLEARTNRLKLTPRKKPYDFTTISPGIALGYRRCVSAGRWVVKVAGGHGARWTKVVGFADDFEPADGEHILSWWEAQGKARKLARGQDTDSARPATVDEAIADYARDLITRNAGPANARRARAIVPASMLAKPVSLLRIGELRRLRDNLVAQGAKPASVNRDMKGLKAALTLAAKHDPRIANSNAWKNGLEALPDAYRSTRNILLTDDEVRVLIAAAYAENDALGLLVETAAVTGARISQLGRLDIADLQADRPDPRLMMPSSRKGKGVKRIERKPVPITSDLAIKLKRVAGDRVSSDPLLLRADGKAWQPEIADYRQPVINAVTRAGLDPKRITLYSLRHSSIVRALLAGVPTRVVAAQHDSSVPMLEKAYSAHILDHSDTVARRGLLDLASPSVPVVVRLSERRT